MTQENDTADGDEEMYCERHDLRNAVMPRTDPHCPYCRLERDREAQLRERAERRANPNMHPTVDAPRR